MRSYCWSRAKELSFRLKGVDESKEKSLAGWWKVSKWAFSLKINTVLGKCKKLHLCECVVNLDLV